MESLADAHASRICGLNGRGPILPFKVCQFVSVFTCVFSFVAVTLKCICSTAKFDALVTFLESQKLVGVWEGEFGILGTKSGRDSFLPRKRMPADLLSSLPAAQASGGTDLVLDNGDFCGFLSRSGALYAGTPGMHVLCPAILELAGADVRSSSRVASARRVAGSAGVQARWQVEDHAGAVDEFDAVIFATHDASVPAECVRGLASSEEGQALGAAGRDRLQRLSEGLLAARASRVPLYTLSAEVHGGAASIPFDGVTVVGSDRVQFLARDASKPGRARASDAGGAASAVASGATEVCLDERVIAGARVEPER